MLRFFRDSNKRSFLVSSAGIAHKMRQFKHEAGEAHGPNVYKASLV
jgi:hypothetical protein